MSFNSWTFLFEVVNFLALAYILQRLLYRPLHDAVDRRRQEIELAKSQARHLQLEAEAQKQSLESQRASMAQERQTMLDEARRAADRERDRILAEASREAERGAIEVRELLQRERTEVLQSLQETVAQDARRLAGRMLSEVSGEDLDTRLALRLADAIRSLDQKERTELARGWTDNDTATLESARDLVPTAVESVHAAVSDVLGLDVALQVRAIPELVSGVRLRLEGRTWDASLVGQMEGADNGYASV